MKTFLTMAAFVIATTAGACASTEATHEPAQPAVQGKEDKAQNTDSKKEQIPEPMAEESTTSEEAAPEPATEADSKTEQTPGECPEGKTWVEAHTRKDGVEVKGHCRALPQPSVE